MIQKYEMKVSKTHIYN